MSILRGTMVDVLTATQTWDHTWDWDVDICVERELVRLRILRPLGCSCHTAEDGAMTRKSTNSKSDYQYHQQIPDIMVITVRQALRLLENSFNIKFGSISTGLS